MKKIEEKKSSEENLKKTELKVWNQNWRRTEKKRYTSGLQQQQLEDDEDQEKRLWGEESRGEECAAADFENIKKSPNFD